MKIAAHIQYRYGLIWLLSTPGPVVAGHHGVHWPEMSAAEEQVSLAKMLVATGFGQRPVLNQTSATGSAQTKRNAGE